MIGYPIRKIGILLLTDSMRIPDNIHKSINFFLDYWYHDICEEQPNRKVYIKKCYDMFNTFGHWVTPEKIYPPPTDKFVCNHSKCIRTSKR